MGSFQGHALPGGFFVLFSLWWISQLPRRLLLCKQERIHFFNTVTFPVPFVSLCKSPVEAIAKIVVCFIGMAGELFASTDFGKEDGFVYMGDLQHMTMYSFFFLSGIIDVLVYRGVKGVPKGLDYFALATAYGAETLVFSNHLYGRSSLDVLLHTLLVYVTTACIIVAILECNYQRCLTLCFCRAFLTLLQGTWFFQVGVMLYPPLPGLGHWQEENPAQLVVAIMVFAWHIGGCLIFALFLYLFSYYTYKSHCRVLDYDIEYQLRSDPNNKDTWTDRIRPGFRSLFLTDLMAYDSSSELTDAEDEIV